MVVRREDESAASYQPVNPAEDSPFPGLSFAGELDDTLDQPLEIAMNEKWGGYLNGRLLGEFNKLFPGRLTHMRFLPDPDNGLVIMVPCPDATKYGTFQVEYSPTENGAEVNLRLAVKRLKVEPQKGRVHIFPVVTRKAPDGNLYLAFVTKEAGTRPVRKRKSEESEGQKDGGTEKKEK